MDLMSDFKLTFESKFVVDEHKRWGAFQWIAQTLFDKKHPVNICETGTARTPDNWSGDGQSTLIWDYIAHATDGTAISVDIWAEACARARSQVTRTRVVNCDSMGFLRGFPDAGSLDLLYLDSFDWSKEQHAESCLHHIGELAAIWGRLPKGCLIAVDDCWNRNDGKHVMVKLFFDRIACRPIWESYITVWVKP